MRVDAARVRWIGLAAVLGLACGRGREPAQPPVAQRPSVPAPHEDRHPLIPATRAACTPGGWCRSAELAPAARGAIACFDIWSSPEGLWLVGEGADHVHGELARWDGRTWTREALAGKSLLAAAGRDAPWLLDMDGTLWRRVHDRWSSETTGLGGGFQLAMIDEDHAWAVSSSAVARRVDGTWRSVAIGEHVSVDELAAGSDGSVFVAVSEFGDHSSTSSLLRWDGATLVPVASLEDAAAHLVVYDRQRVDVIERDGSVERWTGGAKLASLATGSDFGTPSGVADAALLGGTVYYVTRSAAAVTVADPTWQRVDVPGVNRVVARDAVVWAMERPSGDLWFKRIAGAPRDPPPVHERGAPSSAIEVRHGNAVAKLLYALPPGWTRTPGDRIVYAHPGGASLEIDVGFDIVDGDAEHALSTAIDELVAAMPSTVVREEMHRTDHGYAVDYTFHDGRDQHDVTCFVKHPDVGFAVRIHATKIGDDGIAAALVEACNAAALW